MSSLGSKQQLSALKLDGRGCGRFSATMDKKD